MSEARWRTGDVFEEMAKLPDNSVDAVICSPPFLALRSYLPADHPQKHLEIGSEPTPAAFLSTLLALTREWRRVLAPHGSLCVELGDTYSGSGGAGGDYGPDGLRDGQPKFRQVGSREHRLEREGTTADGGDRIVPLNGGRGWPLAKSLCLLPTLYPASLAYGRNLLNPDDLLEPWRVRNLIVWHRPNPPVGALGDKVRPSTSYVTVACTAKDRWFDLDSERTALQPGSEKPRSYSAGSKTDAINGQAKVNNNDGQMSNPAGAPPLDCWLDDRSSAEPAIRKAAGRGDPATYGESLDKASAEDAPDADVWTIPTALYAGAHYATWPVALCRKLINLMCPRQVCTSCGEPRRRITAVEYEPRGERHDENKGSRGVVQLGEHAQHMEHGRATKNVETLGWSDCGHNTWRRGIVLDCFGGSGTTGQAAAELGRDSILIDLDGRNLDLARQRLGMFLVEEDVDA